MTKSLPANLQLHNHIIHSLISTENFTLTYLAHHCLLKHPVLIREYFPRDLAERQDNGDLIPHSTHLEFFQRGLKQFIHEGAELAQLHHPHLITLQDAFLAHHTAYWVLQYQTGQSLAQILTHNNTATTAETHQVLHVVLDIFKLLHQQQHFFRTLHPEMLFLTDHGQHILLMELGNTRNCLTSSLETQLSSYTAPELIIGPWSSFYSLASLAYHLVTGQAPVPTNQRLAQIQQGHSDPLIPLTRLAPRTYPKLFLKALHWALLLPLQDRPQTLEIWQKFLFPIPLTTRLFKATTRILTTLSLLIILISIGCGPLAWQQTHLFRHIQQHILSIEREYQKQHSIRLSQIKNQQQQTTDHLYQLLTHPIPSIPNVVTPIKYTPLSIQPTLTLAAHDQGICVEDCLTFNWKGDLLGVGSWDHTVSIWQIPQGTLLKKLLGHTQPVLSVAFSPNQQILISGSADHELKFWEVGTGKLIKTWVEPGTWVSTLSFNFNGLKLAHEADHQQIRLWQFEPLQKKNYSILLESHRSVINTLCFSPDGQWLASGDAEGQVKLWQTATGQLYRSWQEDRQDIFALNFSPNAQWLAAAGAGGSLRIWEIASGQLLKAWQGDQDWILDVEFEPTAGQWLVSGGKEGNLKFWESTTGRSLQVLPYPTEINSLHFSPTGEWLAVGGKDGQVRMWKNVNYLHVSR